MKFNDIEVGKEYAVKYGRSGAVRETCIEKYTRRSGTQACRFTDSSGVQAGLTTIGVLPRSVLGPADEVFAKLEAKEKADKERRQARLKEAHDIQARRAKLVERMEALLGDQLIFRDLRLVNITRYANAQALSEVEAEARTIKVDVKDLESILELFDER